MAFLKSDPDATLIDVFKAYPQFAKPLHEFAHELMRGESPLTAGEREFIAAYVSNLNGCDYCQGSHTAVATKFGIPEELLKSLPSEVDALDVSDKFKVILRYVHKLNERPAEITQRDVDTVLEAGWDEDAFCHATLVCAFFNFMNRWVDGFGIELDGKIAQMAGEMLHKKGYRAILDIV